MRGTKFDVWAICVKRYAFFAAQESQEHTRLAESAHVRGDSAEALWHEARAIWWSVVAELAHAAVQSSSTVEHLQHWAGMYPQHLRDLSLALGQNDPDLLWKGWE